jgi:hypothetical protein
VPLQEVRLPPVEKLIPAWVEVTVASERPRVVRIRELRFIGLYNINCSD